VTVPSSVATVRRMLPSPSMYCLPKSLRTKVADHSVVSNGGAWVTTAPGSARSKATWWRWKSSPTRSPNAGTDSGRPSGPATRLGSASTEAVVDAISSAIVAQDRRFMSVLQVGALRHGRRNDAIFGAADVHADLVTCAVSIATTDCRSRIFFLARGRRAEPVQRNDALPGKARRVRQRMAHGVLPTQRVEQPRLQHGTIERMLAAVAEPPDERDRRPRFAGIEPHPGACAHDLERALRSTLCAEFRQRRFAGGTGVFPIAFRNGRFGARDLGQRRVGTAGGGGSEALRLFLRLVETSIGTQRAYPRQPAVAANPAIRRRGKFGPQHVRHRAAQFGLGRPGSTDRQIEAGALDAHCFRHAGDVVDDRLCEEGIEPLARLREPAATRQHFRPCVIEQGAAERLVHP